MSKLLAISSFLYPQHPQLLSKNDYQELSIENTVWLDDTMALC